MKYQFDETDTQETAQRFSVLAEALQKPGTPFLQSLEKEALEENVPIIRTRTQGLIRFLLDLCAPMRILEIGTATGFSAIFLHTYAPRGCRITTIEKVSYRADEAEKNFARAGISDIQLIRGDASDILPEMASETETEETFDFVFLDAAKAQYIRYLPHIKQLLRPGGVLLTDNILQEGEILASRFAVTRRNRTIHRRMREFLRVLSVPHPPTAPAEIPAFSRFAVTRRNRTIHRRMREFLRVLSEDEELTTVLLEAGDGAAVTVKRREPSGNTIDNYDT